MSEYGKYGFDGVIAKTYIPYLSRFYACHDVRRSSVERTGGCSCSRLVSSDSVPQELDEALDIKLIGR